MFTFKKIILHLIPLAGEFAGQDQPIPFWENPETGEVWHQSPRWFIPRKFPNRSAVAPDFPAVFDRWEETGETKTLGIAEYINLQDYE